MLIAVVGGAVILAAGVLTAAIVSRDGSSPGTGALAQSTSTPTQSTSTPERTVATSGPTGNAGPHSVQIPADQQWTDTQVTCQNGDVLDITASGSIFHNKDDPTSAVGPDGLTDPWFHQFNVSGLPDANTASLIGSVGGTGDPFFVGSSKSYPCERAGTLFLGINDIGVANNSGAFVATIELSTP